MPLLETGRRGERLPSGSRLPLFQLVRAVVGSIHVARALSFRHREARLEADSFRSLIAALLDDPAYEDADAEIQLVHRLRLPEEIQLLASMDGRGLKGADPRGARRTYADLRARGLKRLGSATFELLRPGLCPNRTAPSESGVVGAADRRTPRPSLQASGRDGRTASLDVSERHLEEIVTAVREALETGSPA